MGFWTDITNIEAPASAEVGQAVTVKVTVKNKDAISQYLLVTGYYDGESLPQPYALVPARASYIFTLPFTMPSRSITLQLWSYIWVEYPDQPGAWQDDDYKTASISLAAAGVGGWYEADIWTLSVTREPAGVGGWYEADVWTLSVTRGPVLVEGWYQADVKTISITRPQPPPPPPPDGDEEGKFPWGVALLVAGGAVALAAAIPKKETEGKKTPAKKKG